MCIRDRVVAATHRDLARMTRDGDFRADLLYRLAVVEVRVPPLRERPEDIPFLVRDLAPRIEAETGIAPLRLTADARSVLATHDWPGNVRELYGLLAGALLRSDGRPIRASHLGLPANDRVHDGASLERRMIRSAMSAACGNLAEAARQIGWSRQKLYRRLRVLGVPEVSWSSAAGDTTSSDSSTFQ